ncbi:HD domain protein [Rickettsia endosymbiont of Ixodes pacificus]|uniref:HD domain-containing protein n=1 Tax=Rickettsia endosymbiont of Ixodes pacificus TaxID=1133329 RepID=UPI0005F896C2|nr:HD domain-containing protein [Rickettsia endosymbiont of Ixodes pacificus]KJW02950.1 HD domain protein [Rickettsia endosymbiont of Ixodes pacificus]
MEDISSWKEKFEVCVYTKKLLDKLEYLNTKVKNPVDIEEVKKGIFYARKYHGSQMRQSGDPYYSHPIEVAIMLAVFVAEEAPKLFTSNMINAALLHDTIEDTELTEEVITTIFGLEVANHVEGLTRIKPYGKISAEESLNLLIQQKRYDTALIKLFDRIHNIQTLGAKSPEKAKKIIEETLINFVILAEYLKIPAIKQKIVDLCFQHLSIKQFLAQEDDLFNNFHLFFLMFQNELSRIEKLNR